jgi:hypothetical protein
MISLILFPVHVGQSSGLVFREDIFCVGQPLFADAPFLPKNKIGEGK